MKSFFCISLLLMAIFIGSPGFAQEHPDSTYQLLWKIEHADAPQPSFLFGTVHVKDARVFRFPDSVLAALYACDQIALEVKPEQMTELAVSFEENPGHEAYLSDVLEPEKLAWFDSAFQAACARKISHLQIADLTGFGYRISQPPSRPDDRVTFLDGYLAYLAKGWGKGVTGLEPLSIHTTGDTLPDPEQLEEYLYDMLSSSQAIQHYIESILALYLEGDVEKMGALFGLDDPDKDNRQLNLRNLVMADSASVLIQQAPTFLAMGAAHLPGDSGLISLLRDRGYTLTSVPATYTERYKDFESLPRVEPAWVPVEVPEFGFSLDMPTPPQSYPGLEPSRRLDMRLSVDIEEGLQTLFLSADIHRKWIDLPTDSLYLLFSENMTAGITQEYGNGTIILHEGEIRRDGVIGREFWFLIPKGRERVRMEVYKRGNRIYGFVMGTDNQLLSSPTVERFFQHIRFTDIPEIPKEILYEGRSGSFFEVPLPFEAKVELDRYKARDEYPDGRIFARFYSVSDNTSDLYFQVVDYLRRLPMEEEETDSLSLCVYLDAYRTDREIDSFRVDSFFQVQGFPAMQAHSWGGARLQGYQYQHRLIKRGPRYYVLNVIGDSVGLQEPNVRRYFEEFRLTPLPAIRFDLAYTSPDSSFSLAFPEVVEREYRYGVPSLGEDSSTYLRSTDTLSNITFRTRVLYLNSLHYVSHPDTFFQEIIQYHLVDAGEELFDYESIEYLGLPACQARVGRKNDPSAYYVRGVWAGNRVYLLYAEGSREAEALKLFRYFDKLEIHKMDTAAMNNLQQPWLPRFLEIAKSASDSVFEQGINSTVVRSKSWSLRSEDINADEAARMRTALGDTYVSEKRLAAVSSLLISPLIRRDTSTLCPYLLQLIKSYPGEHPNLGEYADHILGWGTDEEAEEAARMLLFYTPTKDALYIPMAMNRLDERDLMPTYLPLFVATVDSTWIMQGIRWISELDSPGRFPLHQYPFLSENVDSLSALALQTVGEEIRLKKAYPDSTFQGVIAPYLHAIEVLPYFPETPQRRAQVDYFLHNIQYPSSSLSLLTRCIENGWKIPKTAIQAMAASSLTRWRLYRLLHEHPKVGKFPKEFVHPDSLALAYCLAVMGPYAEGLVQLTQSLTYTLDGKEVQGYLVKYGSGEYQTASLCGFFDKKGKPVEDMYLLNSYESWGEKTPETHIAELLKTMEERKNTRAGD